MPLPPGQRHPPAPRAGPYVWLPRRRGAAAISNAHPRSIPAAASRAFFSASPLAGRLSPVRPGPGTNGDVLGPTTGAEPEDTPDDDADAELDGGVDVVEDAELDTGAEL